MMALTAMKSYAMPGGEDNKENRDPKILDNEAVLWAMAMMVFSMGLVFMDFMNKPTSDSIDADWTVIEVEPEPEDAWSSNEMPKPKA